MTTDLQTCFTPPYPSKPGEGNQVRHDEQQALALINQGRLQETEVIYKRLIKQGIKSHLIFGNLGAICAMQGRNQEAVIFLKEATAIKPDDPEVLFNLGVSLSNQDEMPGAIDAYRKAVAIKPDFARALFNLGNALKQEGDLQAAIDAYRKAVAVQPDYTKALFNLGNALKQQGNLGAAIDAYQRAVAIRPDFPEALSHLGNALKERGEMEAAVDAYQKAIAIQPDYANALFNLGNALKDQGRLEAAIGSYNKALMAKPKNPNALANLGSVLHGQGDLSGAIACFRKAISFDENHMASHVNLSHSLLLSGDYEHGWKEYEWRHCINEQGMCHIVPPFEQYNGHNLSQGEELILVSEGALGDTLHFMRYVHYLIKKERNVSFLCLQTKLHTLIQFSGIKLKTFTPEKWNQFTTGKWLPLLSLPQYLKVRPDNPLIDTSYIKAPEQNILRWKQKLADEKKPIIGINWRGSQNGQKGRALPLQAFAPLTETINPSWLSLQKGLGQEELAGCSFRNRFVGCQEDISQTWDFVETAAMVLNCDLIITSDTGVAHLAAGLGKPTWLLLQTVPEWRWGMEGETTFWYRSMRLFRQREPGNWAEVIHRVAGALKALSIPGV